ncbi:UDP-N-acetylglucosamine 2-epimerase [Cohnella phaseoli]|uniref:UDP-N-acetylglucosamine 2-epimerase (Non-hydrolysing)/GDP/UDP-N,N'-diacetylbacillosamine 2-epimerase (Hydrolysing) n=1 Tax=Cohnella phaseoli TaxID=456490 RepID=A0A3D9KCB6_9BACL|nr:UDP-N-acetylglucosamine 2-epimerase [Cohnella phaseoli]RED84038.1 UDP-N-acetylglucosamine 2-epimerase (non-hydrolysing)/GDP/UDP-N,N'-diacetylbacillosamine 2-epimerase (hydrolysing) [Cohnella phaseoli]
MTRRKICVVTGTRAEYGLLYWLMKEIDQDPELELIVAVTGMHLSPEFGSTYQQIEKDGFSIHEKIEILLSSDTAVSITKSIGLGVIGFGEMFDRLKPDLLVILGDRYEIMAAAQAAIISRIPIAHLHGGETTEGAFDEAIRHSITKMSHIHFTAAEPYRRRVIQLGENPSLVFNYGAPGIENINRLKLMDRKSLEDSIGFQFGTLNFLVTYHPVTLDRNGPGGAMGQLLLALDQFPEARIIFTKPNSDTDGRIITALIDEYCERHPTRTKSFISMGQLRYLSAIQYSHVVIGNSSSGIIEVPALKKATVNIGDRQLGRLRSASVIDCSEDQESIVSSIRYAMSEKFQNELDSVEHIYGDGQTSLKIKEVLKTVNLDGILKKSFYDYPLH